MARPPLVEGEIEQLQRVIREIGVRLGESLGESLLAGLDAGMARATTPRPVGRPPRSMGSENPCLVPDCVRPALAKGLCATHYRKARRINLPSGLDEKSLAALAEDGRKKRAR